jgi:hypothetical protein
VSLGRDAILAKEKIISYYLTLLDLHVAIIDLISLQILLQVLVVVAEDFITVAELFVPRLGDRNFQPALS